MGKTKIPVDKESLCKLLQTGTKVSDFKGGAYLNINDKKFFTPKELLSIKKAIDSLNISDEYKALVLNRWIRRKEAIISASTFRHATFIDLLIIEGSKKEIMIRTGFEEWEWMYCKSPLKDALNRAVRRGVKIMVSIIGEDFSIGFTLDKEIP